MAIWVNTNRAAKFPEVVRVYSRAGGGQGVAGPTQPYSGNPPNEAPKGFLTTVRLAIQSGAALPSWIRKSPLGAGDWQNSQVDVTAIPGTRPMNTNGKSKQFIA